MPRHFLYNMKGTDKAPAGDGDTKSWFRYYKWDTEDEVFVPRLRPFYDASPGDFIWFVMDGWVIGGAPILRVELESSQGRQEIWYDTRQKLLLVNQYATIWDGEGDPEVSEEFVSAWLAAAKKYEPQEALDTK